MRMVDVRDQAIRGALLSTLAVVVRPVLSRPFTLGLLCSAALGISCLAAVTTAHASQAPSAERGEERKESETIAADRMVPLQTAGGVSEFFGGANINRPVDGDVQAVSGPVSVQAPVSGSVRCGFGSLRVLAPVSGDVESGFGDVYIDSVVAGDVDVGSGGLVLGPRARILGHVSVADGRILMADGSAVRGPVESGIDTVFVHGTSAPLSPGPSGKALVAAAFSAYGLLAVLMIRRHLLTPARTLTRWPFRSLLVGLMSVMIAGATVLILAISVVGIPLLVLFIPALLALALFGAAAAAFGVGQRLLSAVGVRPGGYGVTAMLTGVATVAAAYAIPVVGDAILLGIAVQGTGAAVLTIRHSKVVRRHFPPRSEPGS